jgi:ABC-type enterochelin transport system substrate-binding protein
MKDASRVVYLGLTHSAFMVKGLDMKYTLLALVVAFALTGCDTTNKQAAEQAAQQGAPQTAANTQAPAKQDISTEALAKIDPDVVTYDEAVAKAKSAYDAKKDAASKTALVEAYVRFADYMTYESPVSPRQGKYHRALVEYRHALALDAGNEKVLKEISQIEDIYRSMGRPIPGAEG